MWTTPTDSQLIARRLIVRTSGQRPEEEQGVDDVARQEVAVDGLEAGAPGVLDAAVGDLDRLGPPVHEVEDGRQVGARPEQRVRVVELEGGRLRLAQQLDRGRRVAPPRERDGERRRRVDLLGARRRVAGAGDPDRLAREPLRVREDAVEHLELGEAGQDGRALRARLARDELDRAPGRQHRPGRIAAGPADLRQALVEQPEADAVAPGVEPGDGRLEERRRARDPPDREGGLGGPDLEIDPVRRRRGPTARAAPGAGPSGSDSASLERLELVGGRVSRRRRTPAASMAAVRAACGSCAASQCQRDRRRRPAERLGEGGVVARPRDRQQVARDGAPDRLVAERERARRPRRRSRRRAPPPSRPTGRRRGRRRRSAGRSRSAAPPGRCRRRRRPRRAASCSGVSGRSASDMRRRTRRHSRERIASRAMISSSNDPLSDADGSSRRAASSSSVTSGRPPDRSATSSSRLAEARSPSMPSISAASSSRSSGGRTTRSGVRGPVPMASRSAIHGSSRATASSWCDPTMARRWSREIRARNVTSARVAASARWRSSSASTTGRRSPSRPSRPRMPSSVRAWRRSGRRPAAAPGRRPGDVEDRREVGQEPDDLGRGRSEQVGQLVERQAPAGSARWPGRSVRTARRRRAGQAVARRTVIGSPSACIRAMASSMKRVTPTPAVPSSRIVRARPPAASSSPAARRANASSRPTKRALEWLAGMAAFYGPRRLGWPCHDRPPARAPPGQHAQRAARGGVAVLHEVAADDGLPVRARPSRAARPRREQAAAADGPPDRVLHAGPASSSSTRSRASAGRCSGRPSRAVRGGRSASSSTRAGRRSSTTSCATCPPSATASGPSWPTSARPTRAGRGRSTRPGWICGSATRWRCCRRSRPSSIDFVATDPPYNLQLPMTMAGGALAETHANRRTDYAMVTDSPDDLANAADYPAFLDRMGAVFGELRAGAARRPLRGRHRPRRLPGRAVRLHRLGPGGAGRRPPASCPRATSSGTRPARGCGRTAIRGRSSRTSSTSTCWCCARSAGRQASRGGATRGRRRRRRCRCRTRPSSSCRRRSASSRPGTSAGGAVAIDDLAEDHLVQPALLSVRAQDEPVGAVLLEQLDLVALVEVADLGATELVGRVEQPDDPVADDPPLAAGQRADEALAEGQARGRRAVADRVGLAGLEERRSPPARHAAIRRSLARPARPAARRRRADARASRRSARPSRRADSGRRRRRWRPRPPGPRRRARRRGGVARTGRTPSPSRPRRWSSRASGRG